MKVLIFEDNLMWSTRLRQSVQGLGHEAQVLTSLPDDGRGARVAIVNLGSDRLGASLVEPLHALGLKVVGHAGHKEKELLDLGREAGCDRLATNSELTFKLPQILEELASSE